MKARRELRITDRALTWLDAVCTHAARSAGTERTALFGRRKDQALVRARMDVIRCIMSDPRPLVAKVENGRVHVGLRGESIGDDPPGISVAALADIWDLDHTVILSLLRRARQLGDSTAPLSPAPPEPPELTS